MDELVGSLKQELRRVLEQEHVCSVARYGEHVYCVWGG